MGFTRIDPTIKARWTTALRSGHYAQGRGSLLQYAFVSDGRRLEGHYDTTAPIGYCCLGVGADDCLDGAFSESGDEYITTDGTTYDGEGSYYVQDALDDLGEYVHAHPEYLFGMDHETINHLIDLNDNLDADFNTIADWIEAHL